MGPNDLQCWRCGEMINAQPPRPVPRGAVGIREAKDVVPTKKPKVTAGLRSLTEMQGGRHTVLQERERELRQEMEALEQEARDLERAAERLQAERAALEARQRELDVREEELDALALVIEPALQAVEDLHMRGDVCSDALGDALEAAQDLSAALEKERARIRAEIEKEMADRLAGISQLESGLKAAHDSTRPPTEEDREAVVSEIDVQEMVRQVARLAREQAAVAIAPEEPPFSTYIEALDQIMAGGVPRGSVLLLNGPGGSMKTTLAYHMLHRAAEHGIKGMFFSLEQSRDSLIRQMKGLGMDRRASQDNLIVADMVELRRSMEGQKGNWHEIVMRYVSNEMTKGSAQLFVLDSFESFMALSERSLSRVEVQDLFDAFRDLGLTSIVISETPMASLESNEHMELYVADGALELAMVEGNDSRIQRWLRCVKLRGANIDTRFYCLLHQDGGFTLSPPMGSCSSGSLLE